MEGRIKALFAVTGTKEELRELEVSLIEKDIRGVMSNETARHANFKWIVVYADFNDIKSPATKLFYAYRSTNCRDTSKPSVLKLKTVKSRIDRDYYKEVRIKPKGLFW